MLAVRFEPDGTLVQAIWSRPPYPQQQSASNIIKALNIKKEKNRDRDEQKARF